MADETKAKIVQAIKGYTKGEKFGYILQKNHELAEQILNIEESDIILGERNEPIKIADVRLGGIARFHYHFSGDESGTKRFSSCDFTTSEYHRVLLNEEKLRPNGSIKDYCNEISKRYAQVKPDFKHKYINATSLDLKRSVQAEAKEQVDSEIYARANAYLNDLEVVNVHYVDSVGDQTIPACRMPINMKAKDKKGNETEIYVGDLYDLDGIEQVDLKLDSYYRSLKKKSTAWKVLSIIGSILAVAAVVLYFVLR